MMMRVVKDESSKEESGDVTTQNIKEIQKLCLEKTDEIEKLFAKI